MLSDLANSVKGVDLRAQDDTFLVSHLVAGNAEVDELEQIIASLTARKSEAAAIRNSVERTLIDRHPEGKTFAFGTAIIAVEGPKIVGRDDTGTLGRVTISQAQILALPELKEGMVQVSRTKKIPDPAAPPAPRRVK